MTALTITAHLSTPIVGMDRLMLDGPLSWAYAELQLQAGRHVPAITPSFAADFPLPLERWEEGGTWGWCCSQGVEDIIQWTTVQIRRKPATDAMTRYTRDRRHHAGLGPLKARDQSIQGRLVRTVTWEALVTDRAELERLLAVVTCVSARWRNGFGRVEKWVVETSRNPQGWRNRPMPHPGGIPTPVRPPYWHQTRSVPCALPEGSR